MVIRTPNRLALLFQPFRNPFPKELVQELEVHDVTILSFCDTFGYRWTRQCYNSKTYTHFFFFHSSNREVLNTITVAKLSSEVVSGLIVVVDDQQIVKKYLKALKAVEQSTLSPEGVKFNNLSEEIKADKEELQLLRSRMMELDRRLDKKMFQQQDLKEIIDRKMFKRMTKLLG